MKEATTKKKKIFKTVLACATIIGAAALTVFGVSFGSAMSNAEIDRAEARETAIEFVKNSGIAKSGENVFVVDTEFDFEMEPALTASYVLYEIELVTAGGKTIELEVNASNKNVNVKSIEID